MKTKIRKTNIKRLASLSALGAGALAVTGGAAQANSIVYSGPLNITVPNNGATIAGPHGFDGVFGFSAFSSTGSANREVGLGFSGGHHGTFGAARHPKGSSFLRHFRSKPSGAVLPRTGAVW
jgi:hypothetical protein